MIWLNFNMVSCYLFSNPPICTSFLFSSFSAFLCINWVFLWFHFISSAGLLASCFIFSDCSMVYNIFYCKYKYTLLILTYLKIIYHFTYSVKNLMAMYLIFWLWSSLMSLPCILLLHFINSIIQWKILALKRQNF